MTNEMTAEEAVKQIKGNCYFASISEKTKEALDMAIKALEQQPCIEDYPTCTECEHYDKEKHYCPRFCQVIKDTLAEAQPCEDCISREAVIDHINLYPKIIGDRSALVLEIKKLSPVTPQRPKGKWIKEKGCLLVYRCSNCKKFVYSRESESDEKFEDLSRLDSYKYCPRCGAYMGGGEDEVNN